MLEKAATTMVTFRNVYYYIYQRVQIHLAS